MRSVFVIGLSHQTASVKIRGQLAVVKPLLDTALRDHARKTISETVVLSTCNRLEIYVAAEDTAKAAAEVERMLDVILGPASEEIRSHLYTLNDNHAVEHLMRVAAGLESRILGENQILGQASQAFRDASAAGSTGAILDRLFTLAIHAGKRVHAETGIGRFPTSISHAAVNLLERKVGNLERTKLLLIGAGKMASLTAELLSKHGANELAVINRTLARAEALVSLPHRRIFQWEQLASAMMWADAVITATGSDEPVLRASHLQRRAAASNARPLLIIDMGAPRNVDLDAASLPGVEYAGIDELDSTLDENLDKRRAAIPEAERIVEEEVAAFMAWCHNRSIVPLITDLRRKVEQVAASELELALNGLTNLDPEHRKIITRLVHRVTNKLLHEPTVRLKSAHAVGDNYSIAVRHLFALGDANAVTSNGQALQGTTIQ
jgi:glutamyl-tRNA reductase